MKKSIFDVNQNGVESENFVIETHMFNRLKLSNLETLSV
jgi:hypothetical protein